MYDREAVAFEGDQENWEYAGEAVLPGEFGFEADEAVFAGEGGVLAEEGPVFAEEEELALAGELLGVSTEEELDRFLGGLIKRAARGVGKFVRSPLGNAIGGVLKGVAKTALPLAGGALGTAIGGPIGGMIGGKLASAAGSLFGLETSGMSEEDEQYEVARRFIRLAGATVRNVLGTPPGVSAVDAARAGLRAAARVYAPGLVRPGAVRVPGVYPRPIPVPVPVPSPGVVAGPARPLRRWPTTGTWVRRGGTIFLRLW